MRVFFFQKGKRGTTLSLLAHRVSVLISVNRPTHNYCCGLLNLHPVNVFPGICVAERGVLISEPYVAVPALFASISVESVPVQLIVIVFASHIAEPDGYALNIAARNARLIEPLTFRVPAQISVHSLAQEKAPKLP